MTRRMTKEELDEQFELFLKESMSDDSVDLGSSEKQTGAKGKGQKSAQKPTVSWWEDDNDKEKSKRRFIKTPKRQAENAEVARPPEPVPKPRSSALVQLHSAPVTEQDVYRTKPSLDASFSVSTSTPSNLQGAPAGDPSPEDKPLSSPDSDPQGGSSDELGGSGKSFLKSLRKTQTIREEEEEEGADRRRKAEVPKRDNTETQDLVLTPALASVLGMDTLEEEEEKARFFAELEAGASSTIDYSKLNKDLDSTTSTGIGKVEEVLGQTDTDQIKDKENPRESPGSPHYSEDFEDEGDGKGTEEEEKLKLSPILAKVSLYDSLDDTRDVDSRKTTAASLDKGQSYGQSGGSDMEALHEAYRQIQVVQDSGELNRTFLSSENRDKPDLPQSPASPPPHLRPASTYESDLPTAEELMKPIRPEDDHLRGFSLQPVTASALDHIQGKTSESKEMQSTFMESPQRKPEEWFEGEKQPLSGWTTTTTTSHPPTAPEPPLIQERTWNIRDEVERLMQDQESSNKSAQTNRAKKPQVSRPTNSSLSHTRRLTAAPVRGRSLDSKTTLMSRPSSVPGPNPLQSSYTKPSQQSSTRTTKGPEKTRNQLYSEPGSKVSSDLVESVQSLVSVLHQQIHTKHQEPATTHHETILQHSPTRQKEEDSSVMEDLRARLLEKEKQLQQLKQDADELNSVKQQNYLLQSKLRSAEEAIQKNRLTDAMDSAQQEKLQHINKEMKEQEMLIQGYQQENERLYQQMKAQQARTKANEEAMFNENQRLLSELAFTREQLNKTQKPVSNLCSMDHSQRITQLLAQINVFQRTEVKQSEEICHLKQEKQALEVDLQLLKKERDQARDQFQNRTKDQGQDQATSVSGDRVYELRVMEEKHREEVSELKRKLAWFAENQELLDRDAARLRAATAEILQLKEQVEKLKMEVSKRSNEQQQQNKSRDKSADAKRMRDLERQVKELKQILRSRNPNSLPALIFAAASAPDPSHPSDASPPSRVTALLERRVRRLEAELEAHDEEAKRILRAMEQQFQTIRMRYEQQISELEQQLVQKQQKEAVVSDPVQVQSLTEELRREREAHRQKETALQNQLDTLQQQLKLKAHSSPSRHQRQAEAALGVRLERLNQELSTKTRTIQDLTKTVERLQRERRNMLSVPVLRPEGRGAEAKRPAVLKKPAPVTVEEEETTEMFPEAQCEKTYQPTVFTGSHISEVLQENEALQQRLQQIQEDSERERRELKSEVTEARDQISRLKEEHSKQLSSVQAEHLRAETQLRSAFALEHSSSAVAELTNQLHTQQILVQHLQDQLKELQSCREALTVSKTREDALQKQLSRLLQDLKEARDSQSPEVKLLWTLERKIHHMEQRHQHRERELQQVIGAVIPDVDMQTEVDRWKRVAQDKTRELECFRLELDSILDIIRHLQKQGVVLPAPDPHRTVPPTR